MARPTTAGRRYAEAAFELAARDDAFDAWSDGLALAARFAGDEGVIRVVDNPSIAHADRLATVARLLDGRVTPGVLNLARLLARRGRFETLPAIAAEYTRLLNRRRGIVEAVVTSAQPLTAEETAALRARVEAMTGRAVSLREEIDAALIGGLTVRVGDELLDASVRGRLERLRHQLVGTTR
ncbi:MAG TPA: F0F1 ATP synthase subunit delta [Candidatus Sulfomarinibacteraceae bacterium]|nr:F0F1 ATP synthase subunit delta [Candidatus Sulfomarinibacteraceae bacterium]